MRLNKRGRERVRANANHLGYKVERAINMDAALARQPRDEVSDAVSGQSAAMNSKTKQAIVSGRRHTLT